MQLARQSVKSFLICLNMSQLVDNEVVMHYVEYCQKVLISVNRTLLVCQGQFYPLPHFVTSRLQTKAYLCATIRQCILNTYSPFSQILTLQSIHVISRFKFN